MKTLYIQCNMGIAGDMLVGALLDLQTDKQQCVDFLNKLFHPKASVSLDTVNKCGLTGSHFMVVADGHIEGDHSHIHEHEHTHNHTHDHQHCHNDHTHIHAHNHEHSHSHNSIHDIALTIDSLPLADNIKYQAKLVYDEIARAESKVHGVSVDQIHFHEVGDIDAVVDIVSALWLIDRLNVQQIVFSPINTGSGTVRCQHGVLPVPAPATAEILQGMPCYSDGTPTELATPTGCALAKVLASSFGDMPNMNTIKCGYGMGTKDFKDKANCVRVILGETQQPDVWEVSCNLDDMTGEHIAYAMDKLLQSGALDVYYFDLVSKKNRPAIQLNCLTDNEHLSAVQHAMLQHTTTLGVRTTPFVRKTLDRQTSIVHTQYGDVRVKQAYGYGIEKYKAEFEDVKKLADQHNVSLATIDDAVKHSKK